ncbi:DE-cadherin-like isoform X4 [Macrobrachium rosenbergii]|uniref:DE-cadherin-like isoform X4 n=1 Tax=Macrobrachium rosenbergii TaxID=79674 RepID=UPI0034D57BC7
MRESRRTWPSAAKMPGVGIGLSLLECLVVFFVVVSQDSRTSTAFAASSVDSPSSSSSSSSAASFSSSLAWPLSFSSLTDSSSLMSPYSSPPLHSHDDHHPHQQQEQHTQQEEETGEEQQKQPEKHSQSLTHHQERLEEWQPEQPSQQPDQQSQLPEQHLQHPHERRSRHQHHFRDQNGHKVRHHREIRTKRQLSNRHQPKFSHTEYHRTIKENIPLHTSILQVHASDNDLDHNGLIRYSVSDPEHFEIDDGGIIYNIKPLDYEHTNGRYVLSVTAEDQGSPTERRRAVAKAYIDVLNTPEPPIFDSDQYYFSVTEYAKVGTYIGTVVARDYDGDFSYYDLDGFGSANFVVDRSTGIISLANNTFNNIWAFDFRALAVDASGHKTYVPVRVNIMDENTHTPNFPDCAHYDGVQVAEEERPGKSVIVVVAYDEDHGDNGIVKYSLLQHTDTFEIETKSGQGYVKTTRTLDRDDKDKDFFLTVIAKDSAPADAALQDSCSFRVIVADINDNAPIFDQQKYEQNIATDHPKNNPVLRVTATDLDDMDNSVIEYSLQEAGGTRGDLDYFSITPSNGIITLVKDLSADMAGKKTFKLTAKATDKGVPPLSSTSTVLINVVESGNLPPSIISKTPIQDKLYEDATENTDVVIVCAKSNIEDKPEVYFYLINGNTRDTNEDGTFAIRNLNSGDPHCPSDSRGTMIYLDLRNLDYEAVTAYKLVLQVANDMNARKNEQIIVNVTDVNDNPPVLQPFDGSVLENNDKTLITTIKALDKDVSPEFRTLTYQIVDDASESVKTKFELRNNGQLWTKEALDRETENQYRVPINVTDGLHWRSTTYWITVQDVNDVAPRFNLDEGIYEVRLPESRGVDKPTGLVLYVDDPDVVNYFDYQIVSGNEAGKFKIDSLTGDIKVNKELDYDEPNNDRNFTMKIRLSDGANFPAEIDVVISVENENDLQPKFLQPNYTFSVKENEPCDFYFGDVSAIDPDLPADQNQRIFYYLFDPDRNNFTIGEKTGQLKTKGCLDREAATRGVMTFYPRAMDDDGKGHDAEPATVYLTIIDENDNHPYIQSPDQSYAKIMENMPPENVKPIAIQLDDADSEENGCPCTLEFASFTSPDIMQKFSVSLVDEASSLYELRPLKELDREKVKFYQIPFTTIDKKGVSGTRYLTLEVGDQNDSPMTDGTSTIQVYNYQGQFPAMVIGTVYVTDEDDHDIGDKYFDIDATTPPETEPYFSVDHDTGSITMRKGTPEGDHTLRVKVHDKFRNETAIGEVLIKVVDLTEEAVKHSGSFRLANYTALQLITQKDLASMGTSMYDRLRQKIGEMHLIDSANVDIFGLRDVEGGVDIRYNCHSSPYYTSARLDGLMMLHRKSIMDSLGIKIPMVDINMCLYENLSPCNKSSCQHSLRPNLTHPLLLSSETSTVVGIDISDDYTCSCGPLEPLPSVCYEGFCMNGGTCDDSNGTLVCHCPDNDNYGPRCELYSARFERGYSWYEPFTVCDNSSILLSFETREPSGILMYAGPTVARPWTDYPRDFIYVVINNWRLETYVDFGTGTAVITIPLETNTDRAFDYRIWWDDKTITFDVKNCLGNKTTETLDCRKVIYLPGDVNTSNLLNVQGPLQLGGVAAMISFAALSSSYGWSKTPPTIEPFYGCILELRYNDYLYDLNSTDYGKHTFMPCDAPVTATIVLGEQSIIIIVVSLLCLLLLVLLILCLARRRQKSISYPDLDGIVKETIGGTDLEGFGEKDMTQYDLKLLRVGPNGHLFSGEEERRLPDVAEDARQQRAPLAQMPEGLSIGDFIDDNIKKVDKEITDFDDVRHYCFEGDEMSIASLSSIGSGGSSDSESLFDYRNDWGPRFEKLSKIYRRESDEEEDSEYDFKIPRQPKRYSLHSSPEKKSSPTGNPTGSEHSTKKSSGRPSGSPTVTFAEPETQGSREGLRQGGDDPERPHEAVNPIANYNLDEAAESWC